MPVPATGAATPVRIECPLLGVLARELESASVGVAPGRGIVLVSQKFSAEVQDVPAANHGHDIGGIPRELLVHGVGAGIEPGIGIGASEVNRREIICLGELPAQLAGVSLVQGKVGEIVQLIRETDSDFVNRGWADVPDVSNLGVIVVDIARSGIRWGRP